jgi:hypothetical protein
MNAFYYYSFGSYYNPVLQGFGSLKAVNIIELHKMEQLNK